MRKGSKHSDEAREKIRAARALQGPTWNAGIKTGPEPEETRAKKRAAQNRIWHGSEPPPRIVTTYSGMHTKLRRIARASDKTCEAGTLGMLECRARAFDHALRKDAAEVLIDKRINRKFSLRVDDYGFLCRPCHGEYDNNKIELRDRPKAISGSKHWKAKLTEKDVEQIRARRGAGERLKTIANDFSVSLSSISKIALNVSWKEEEHDNVEESKAV